LDPAHQAPLLSLKIGARMQRAAIVPQQHVVRTPDVLLDESPLFRRVENLPAFFVR